MPKKNSDALPAGENAPVSRPKVFISYSWSSPGHQERVRLWAERLLQDGIEVVLDIYDLKEGHDKYSFMERMVTDPEITHVLVMCDRAYAERADARRAGVGTESQIISKEVYEKVQQSKFIPIACEFTESGEPFLPVFLRPRIWINFSSSEAANENWEQLVRALYGKPAYQKPSVGAVPAYIISDDSEPSNPAVGKFSTFKHALLNNSRAVSVYRADFLSACISHADALRVRQQPDLASLASKIVQDSEKLKGVRNLIVDWVLLESRIDNSADFHDALLEFLESLRELKSRPAEVNSWHDSWFEAHSVFVYETFLYLIAALLKTGSYETLNDVFTSHYVRPKSERYSNTKLDNFGCFYGYSETLQQAMAPPGRTLRSPAAELIKRQADRDDLPFPSVIEAELLALLMSFVLPDVRWYPQTLHYASQSEFPLFVRATRHRDFLKLSKITGVQDADSLRKLVVEGYERLGVDRWHDFAMMTASFWALMNMDNLDSLK
jgi:hypothetical protein